MKLLRKNNFEIPEETLFEFSLKSRPGVNIKVNNKYFNIVSDNKGSNLITEFIPEFELTEEEFYKLKNKD